jgi:hypothetical protein
MNNEPVAWTDGKGNYFDKNSFFPVDDLTPLYTHPIKELTDEKIATMLRQQQAEIEALKTELKLIDELVTGKAQEK